MLRLATFAQRLGGLVAAVVLAVLAFGPAVDAAICGGEDLASAAQGSTITAAALAQGHLDRAHHDERGDVCAHGHCHHVAPCTPDNEAEASTLMTVRDRLPLPQVDLPRSRLSFDLDRPPRA